MHHPRRAQARPPTQAACWGGASAVRHRKAWRRAGIALLREARTRQGRQAAGQQEQSSLLDGGPHPS
jgi:hypothetical protein